MHAVVKTEWGPGAEVMAVDPPEIRDDEVLVEVKAASICGTDIHIWDWYEWVRERIKPPVIIGHEVAGEVVEVGRSVADLRMGDMVSAESHIVDGTCYQCRTGKMHVCQNVEVLGLDRDGAFADYVALPERNAWKNNPNLDPFIASIQEPMGNAFHAVLPDGNPEDIAGKYTAVMGCGPIGLMAIAVLKKLGAEKVFATEVERVRMELAWRMGADMVLDVEEEGEGLVKRVLDATDGRGVDVALEMSGAASALGQAFEILTPGGRVSLLGLPTKPVEIDVTRLVISKAATIHGIFGRRMFQTWYQMRGFLADQDFRDRIVQIITHKVPMGDIVEGMELIHSRRAAKVALTPEW